MQISISLQNWTRTLREAIQSHPLWGAQCVVCVALGPSGRQMGIAGRAWPTSPEQPRKEELLVSVSRLRLYV